MSVFLHYSRYYDLLYRDKDYAVEAKYVHGLLDKYGQNVKELLDIGCGTGKHALEMAKNGFHVHGIDKSAGMLKASKKRKSNLDPDIRERLSFSHGDIRTYSSTRCFDAITALFHVISYQVSNSDLTSSIGAVASSLNHDGIFIFDCWYGPAVLTQHPKVRIKRMADEKIQVLRIAEPILDPVRNSVDVNYTILITNKETGSIKKYCETHSMRYMFTPEMEMLLNSNGLQLLHAEEWMTAKPPGVDTWGVCFIACKK